MVKILISINILIPLLLIATFSILRYERKKVEEINNQKDRDNQIDQLIYKKDFIGPIVVTILFLVLYLVETSYMALYGINWSQYIVDDVWLFLILAFMMGAYYLYFLFKIRRFAKAELSKESIISEG